MFKVWSKILRDAAGNEGAAGAGGGGNTLLGGASGGSGGNADEAAAAAAAAAKAAADKGSAGASWRDALPEAVRDNATIKKYGTVEDLANAYLNAQKLIGGNKMIVPNENTSDDEWKQIFNKLGVPEKVDDYKVAFKEGVSIDKEFAANFQKTAHALGVLPKQAQKLAEWFSDINLGAESKLVAARDTAFKKTVETLQTEWGKAYDLNLGRANKVLNEIGGDDMVKHFNTLGLGADSTTLKFLAKIGETLYKEDEIKGGGGSGTSPMNPKEIQAEINKITGDSKHPYFLKDHPGHKAAVDQMRQLHEDLYKPNK